MLTPEQWAGEWERQWERPAARAILCGTCDAPLRRAEDIARCPYCGEARSRYSSAVELMTVDDIVRRVMRSRTMRRIEDEDGG